MEVNPGCIATLGTFVTDLHGVPRGVAPDIDRRCPPDSLYQGLPWEKPYISNEVVSDLVRTGKAAAGGPGNLAPQIAHALKAQDITGQTFSVGRLGYGDMQGLDPAGRFFFDTLVTNGVCLQPQIDQIYESGTTLVVPTNHEGQRPGIAYYPGANHATDLQQAMADIRRVHASVVHYMYLGLMGDRDWELPVLLRACRRQGIITSMDVHTLVLDQERNAEFRRDKPVHPFLLLKLALPETDIFFCSQDEAPLLAGVLGIKVPPPQNDTPRERERFQRAFLRELYEEYAGGDRRPLFGVTAKEGAYCLVRGEEPKFVASRFMVPFKGGNLIGAGDAFRAGVLLYTSCHQEQFKQGKMNYEHAVSMGNLMAALSISAPLSDRYAQIGPCGQMIEVVRSGEIFEDLGQLVRAVGGRLPQ